MLGNKARDGYSNYEYIKTQELKRSTLAFLQTGRAHKK